MVNGARYGRGRTRDADLADSFCAYRAHVLIQFVHPQRLKGANLGISRHVILREIVARCFCNRDRIEM
jgi:hypothetical protein